MWNAPNGQCILGYDENENPINKNCPNHGWNFEDPENETNTSDSQGHGTHIAGIIGATANNGGVVGVSQNAKIMAVKIGDGFGTIVGAVQGVEVAQNNGAKIINASWGVEAEYVNELQTAISNFLDTDGLIVAASGNSGLNIDNPITDPPYPALFNFDGIISVAATDQGDVIYNDSNYGGNSVDLAAPGVNILSTDFDEDQDGVHEYEYKTGTSMATPFVTGVAAMIMGAYPDLTTSQVKEIIMQSGDY